MRPSWDHTALYIILAYSEIEKQRGINILSIVGQTVSDTGQLRSVRADSVDIEPIGVPASAVGLGPVVVAGEDNALAVGGPAGGVVPAIGKLVGLAGGEVQDVQTQRGFSSKAPLAVDNGRSIGGPRGETRVVRSIGQVGVPGTVGESVVDLGGVGGAADEPGTEAGHQLRAIGVPGGLEGTRITFLKPLDLGGVADVVNVVGVESVDNIGVDRGGVDQRAVGTAEDLLGRRNTVNDGVVHGKDIHVAVLPLGVIAPELQLGSLLSPVGDPVDELGAIGGPPRITHVGQVEGAVGEVGLGVVNALVVTGLDKITDVGRVANVVLTDLGVATGGVGNDVGASSKVHTVDLCSDGLLLSRHTVAAIGVFSSHIVVDDALAIRRELRSTQRVALLADDGAEVTAIGADSVHTQSLGVLPAGTIAVASPVGVAIRTEDDPLSIGGPRGAEVASGPGVVSSVGRGVGQVLGLS